MKDELTAPEADQALKAYEKYICTQTSFNWKDLYDVAESLFKALRASAWQPIDKTKFKLVPISSFKEIESVTAQIKLMAFTSAGLPALQEEMKMYAIWAGILEKAIKSTAPETTP